MSEEKVNKDDAPGDLYKTASSRFTPLGNFLVLISVAAIFGMWAEYDHEMPDIIVPLGEDSNFNGDVYLKIHNKRTEKIQNSYGIISERVKSHENVYCRLFPHLNSNFHRISVGIYPGGRAGRLISSSKTESEAGQRMNRLYRRRTLVAHYKPLGIVQVVLLFTGIFMQGEGKKRTARKKQRIKNSIQDNAGNTPLMTAIHNNHLNKAITFLAQMVYVEQRNSAGESALTLGLQSILPTDLILDIIDKTLHTNQKTVALQTPLQLALESGRPSSVIKKLIKKGAGTDFVTKTGETALILAAKYSEEPEIIGLLLKEGVDPKCADQAKRTAIEYARENKKIIGTSEFWLLHDVSSS